MSTFVIFTCAIIAFFTSKNLIYDRISKVFIYLYLAWWYIWLIISTFNPYDIFEVSTFTYLLLIANVMFFLFGFVLGNRKTTTNYNYIQVNFDNSIFKSKLFLIVLFIFIALILFYLKKYFLVLAISNAAEGRTALFEEGDLFSSHYEILLFNLIIKPYSSFIIISTILILLFCKRKLLLIPTTIYFLSYSFIGSGRGAYISVLIMLMYTYLIRKSILKTSNFQIEKYTYGKKSNRENLKMRLIIVTLIIVSLFFTSYITAMRMGEDTLSIESISIGWNEFLKQGVWYMTGPFRTLDYAIEQNYVGKTGLLYGRTYFAGFDAIIKMIVHFFGGKYISSGEITTMMLQNDYIYIGGGISVNFAYTCVMAYLFDFGYVGVIILPFVTGLFIRKVIKTYDEKPTLPLLMLIIYLFSIMINTVFKWGFQFIDTVVFTVVLLMYHKFIIRKTRVANSVVSKKFAYP